MNILERRIRHFRDKDQTSGEGAEQKAKAELQSFLNINYRVVGAMRARNQSGGKGFNIDPQELGRLEEYIEKESSGRMHWSDGILCEISDFGEVFEHETLSFGSEPLAEGIQAVRGFHFRFKLEGKNFECVDLDAGESRKYFDQKDSDGKRKFIRRFAERRRSSTIYMGDPEKLPFAFTAFITDVGGKFVIEDVVSYRDTNSYRR